MRTCRRCPGTTSVSYLDRMFGATTDLPGLKAVLAHARNRGVIVVPALDRLGRTVHHTLTSSTSWPSAGSGS